MDVKAILKKSGSIIGLIVLFVVISCLNSSFIDPSNLEKPAASGFYQCLNFLWHDLCYLNRRY